MNLCGESVLVNNESCVLKMHFKTNFIFKIALSIHASYKITFSKLPGFR